MSLDPGIAALLQLIESAPYPPMHEGTPESGRRALRAMTVDLVTDETRVPVGSADDVEVAGLPARRYTPASAADPGADVPTLVYLHGGGFVIGDLDTHDQFCRRLCTGADVVVVAIDYRLAPEAVFPAAVDDALAAVEAVAAEAGGPVYVAGDSAGGNLCAVVAQLRPALVAGQLLIYPATHMAGDYPSRTENGTGYYLDLPMMTWFAGHYLTPDTDLADPRHSPLLAAPEVLAAVAPAVVVTAEFDPLRDEGEAYAAALAAAGVAVETHRYDGLVHGFLDMGVMSPAAAAAVDDIVVRLRGLVRG